ncbi:MAG TPA: sulfite exporter TauE/SafE family protein [candidate division Zixibacteria bacterium]|nr:sulfite exporter TauE/SafE family protein [candidate division Zixibacteria bacterium]
MMDISIIFGYGGMLFLGVVLGVMGAGGSILTVPILIYLFSIPASQATGYSLVIVGTSALIAALEYLRRRQSDIRLVMLFGGPAILGVYIMRRYLFPIVPDPVLSLHGVVLSKDTFVILLFAMVMLMAAISMIRSTTLTELDEVTRRHTQRHTVLISGVGFCVGVLTGFVGVGGGFIILPALMFWGDIPVKTAIGTSLSIIAANALIGFIGELQVSDTIDYSFLGVIIILPIIGIVIGMQLNKKLSADHLKTGFGWFVLIMGISIAIKELSFT